MNLNTSKQAAATAALSYVPEDQIIGVGTGSTVNFFIDALAAQRVRIAGAVASSIDTAQRLKAHGFEVIDLNQVASLPVYIDGADEITRHGAMIKGGGGALTREKIIASVAQQFIAIVDQSKLVDVLGGFPLPVEVIPMAQAAVSRQVIQFGGEPRLRMQAGQPFITDNGNRIIDIVGLKILDPLALEQAITQIVGVVCVGLFASKKANVGLVAQGTQVDVINF